MKRNWGDELRAARKALGHAQEKAAQMMGVSVGTVARWESPRANPSQLGKVALRSYFRMAAEAEHGQTDPDAVVGYPIEQ